MADNRTNEEIAAEALRRYEYDVAERHAFEAGAKWAAAGRAVTPKHGELRFVHPVYIKPEETDR